VNQIKMTREAESHEKRCSTREQGPRLRKRVFSRKKREMRVEKGDRETGVLAATGGVAS